MSISKKRLDELSNIPEEAIDYTDIPELDNNFWNNAQLELPHKKIPVSIRLDDDVLNFFKQSGKGYQSRINAVLRSFYEGATRQKKSGLQWLYSNQKTSSVK